MKDFLAQKEPQKPTEFFRIGKKLLPIWERATGQNYFLYRDKIKQECEKRLRGIGIPVSYMTEIDWESEDEFLIPIDDDDILLPTITSIQSKINERINLITWQRITNYLGTPRKENPSFGGQLDTCNWAIRKSFLAQFLMSERICILARHWHAAFILYPKLGGQPVNPHDLMAKAMAMVTPKVNGVRLEHDSILHLNEEHSIYYLHSASISFLAHKMAKLKDKETEAYIKKLPLHPILEGTCTQ